MMRWPSLLTIILLAGLLPGAGAAAGQDEGQARKLINSQGCKACHALEGNGGTAAASFEDLRARLSRAQVRRQLVNPGQRHGSGRLPDFRHLGADELDALVIFIQPDPNK